MMLSNMFFRVRSPDGFIVLQVASSFPVFSTDFLAAVAAAAMGAAESTSLLFSHDLLDEARSDEEMEEGGDVEEKTGRGRGRSRGGKSRGKGKGKKRGKPQSSPPSSSKIRLSSASRGKGEEEEDQFKKCKACSKWKELDEFNADQAKCKECFNNLRSLKRIAETQKCTKQLSKIEEQDPKQHAALLKAFTKERESCKKSGEKIKFSIVGFKISYQSREGVRGEAEGEMMWEGEYKEFGKTAKAGFLSEAGADANWKGWLNDKTVARDNKGPRNYLRLFVKVRDKVIDFEEMAKQKSLDKEEKLGKNVNEAVPDNRMKFVYGQHGTEQHELGDFASMKRKAANAFASGGVLAEEGLLAPDIEDLIEDVEAKIKRRRLGDRASSKRGNSRGQLGCSSPCCIFALVARMSNICTLGLCIFNVEDKCFVEKNISMFIPDSHGWMYIPVGQHRRWRKFQEEEHNRRDCLL